MRKIPILQRTGDGPFGTDGARLFHIVQIASSLKQVAAEMGGELSKLEFVRYSRHFHKIYTIGF
jgi:hypothetical protein